MEDVTEGAVDISPDIAADWLEKNTTNRKVNQARVRHYARQMSEGNWRFNPGDAAICFDTNGELLNGQHRLWAIIESGTTQKMRVVRGLHESLRKTIDTGYARNAGSVFSFLGYAHPELAAAMYRWQWRHVHALEAVKKNEPYRLREVPGVVPTNEELVNLTIEYPELADYTWAYEQLSVKKMLPPSVANWALYQLTLANIERAAEFWRLFASGTGIDGNSPIEALRRHLINRMTRPHSNTIGDYEMLIALIFKAYNYWMVGKTVRVLSWKPGVDAWPTPIAHT